MLLDNVLVFESGKSRGGNSICFTISKNVKDYISIKFYLPKNILGELNVSATSKLKFGCDKNDFTKWYIIIGTHGYSMKKDGNGNYTAIINCPFNFSNKKMQCVANDDIQVLQNENAIKLNVADIFGTEKLTLK